MIIKSDPISQLSLRNNLNMILFIIVWTSHIVYYVTDLLIFQVGDGTTSVVILAGELLKRLKPFVEEGKEIRKNINL